MRTGTAWACFALAAAALSACDSPAPARVLFTHRCLPIGGAQSPQITVSAVPQSAGLVRFAIEQRGVSVVSRLPGSQRTSAPAVSPVDRVGMITNVVDAVPGLPVTLEIATRDSPAIEGEVCVSADLITDRAGVQAERAFAKAGQEVYTRNWHPAFRHYLAAARTFDSLGSKRQAAMARHALAELAYWRFHRESDSYALGTAALAGFGSADPAIRGAIAVLQSQALQELPRFHEADGPALAHKLVEQARALFRSSGFSQRELSRLHIVDGFLAYQTGDTRDAYERFAQAADECRALADWQCYAGARQNMAALAEQQQDYAVALATYEDALLALKQVSEPDLAADISDNLGRLQGKAGLFQEGEQSRRAAIRLYATLGECGGARRSLSSLGALLVQMGSIADAYVYLGKAISLSCPELLAEIGGGAVFNSEAVSEPDAQPCSRVPDLLDLSTDGRLAVFQALSSLSDALRLEGRVDEARRCIAVAETFAASPRSQVQLANANGTVLLEQGQPLLARTPFSRALNISDSAELPATYDQRGVAYLGLARSALLLNDPGAALRSAYQALRLSSARADVSQIVASLQLLATGLRASNEPREAIHTLRSAVGLIEQVPIDDLDGEKRATYLATQHAVFAELTELLIQQAAGADEAIWTAFEVSEQGRARSLRHAISQTTHLSEAPFSSRAAEEYRDLLIRIAALADRTDSAVRLSEQLEELGQREGQAGNEDQPLDRSQLLRQLGDLDATLVEYAVGRRDMFAFVIDRGRLRVSRLSSRESIAHAAAELTRQLRAAEVVPRRVEAAAEELARLVLWPISQFITQERVIFVPDDALHTVPFAVLPWSREAPGELVVHRAETVLVPSALLIARSRPAGAQRPEEMRFALIGDPVFRNLEWRRECMQSISRPLSSARGGSRSMADWAELLPRLPGTREEVIAIAGLLRQSHPKGRIETRLRCTATPTSLREAADRGSLLLHIATHGRVDAQRPRLSALALTPNSGATSDGAAFGLLDILGLKLQSRLVVLSACDTSRGRLLPGEGVLGLAQAFLQAGAESVLASHWRVEDDATAAFMQSFYRHLLIDRLPAATALRRAQMDQVGNDPSHNWAAFSLYGWPDSSL